MVVRHHPTAAASLIGADEDTLNEVSVPFASPGQLHTVEFPNYGPSGDFDKLPPEIRIMIWGLLLRFPVVFTTPDKLSSHKHLKRLCPANRHDCVDDTLIYTRGQHRRNGGGAYFVSQPSSLIKRSRPRNVDIFAITKWNESWPTQRRRDIDSG